MIESFAHKGLEGFFYEGTKKGIQPKDAQKLGDILDSLHAAVTIKDLNYPGSHLHELKGQLKGFWSVRVTGNWRVIFEFENGNAYQVDYVDYH
ncbi:MAG: peptidase [Deltaproteobacteria bacterium RIFCSPLOWO2_12_FULL_40_28]|nr:MAG: peptidase [Deltaproteobacteria bacterium RIFCSPHIGHO2_02_FULL_40_28]OGQ18929.1 MAG: peptidase [Deltaproteobacteria bacterium RIFCSPHIGHO2_12_FULL_40_32]OGQ39472.1 MAG: peptidase [Deltaproteobacteria bacterium RIFCSPLOWO2_02_FULL_40_36]OGQ53362.1 MAG: peptidase [Deltaproteobacteria bacterium RIFCSPLOWO2_12_FULL_40_28]